MSEFKVVMLANAYPPDILGGGEISTALIARGLVDLGVDLTVVTFSDHDLGRSDLEGVDLVRIDCPNLYWSFRSSQQRPWKKAAWHFARACQRRPASNVASTIASLNPDLIHSSTVEDFGPGIWRWAKRHNIATVHSLRSFCLLHYGATLYNHHHDSHIGPDWLAVQRRKHSQFVDGVIGISNDILSRHISRGFFTRAMRQVIGNPIDQPIELTEIRSSGPIQIGILGRVSPEKGITSFLSALKRVESYPWELKIAGTGNDEDVKRVEHEASGYAVECVGWQDSREFLRQLDFLVVPSRWHEPFGRIVVEAFSVGIPVLCLRRGGLPELVEHGVTGWVVDEWSSEAIAGAIESCRKFDRSPLPRQAGLFEISNIAEKHLSFYRDVLQKNGR